MKGIDQELVRQYGTPLYVYRLDRARRAVADLRAALPEPTRLYYSLKANPHPALVTAFSDMGLDFEVSSVGELAAIGEAGGGNHRTLYTGPGKTPAEIKAALRAGVEEFSVESTADRDRVADAAERSGTTARYIVRLNGPGTAGSGLRMTGKASQFGVDLEDSGTVKDLLEPTGHANPVGLHIFSATNVEGADQLLAELTANAATAGRLLAGLGSRRLVDLGGGFAAPFARPGTRTGYAGIREPLSYALDEHLPGWRAGEPETAFESGRYLTADCGTLLTTVLDVKRSRGTTFVILDAGVHTLGGMWGLGRLLTPAACPQLVGPVDADPATVTLTGPLCTPLDVLSRSIAIPTPAVGDVLSIPNVGAYGLSASLLGFLSRPLPTEVVLDADDAFVEARRLEIRTGDAL